MYWLKHLLRWLACTSPSMCRTKLAGMHSKQAYACIGGTLPAKRKSSQEHIQSHNCKHRKGANLGNIKCEVAHEHKLQLEIVDSMTGDSTNLKHNQRTEKLTSDKCLCKQVGHNEVASAAHGDVHKAISLSIPNRIPIPTPRQHATRPGAPAALALHHWHQLRCGRSRSEGPRAHQSTPKINLVKSRKNIQHRSTPKIKFSQILKKTSHLR